MSLRASFFSIAILVTLWVACGRAEELDDEGTILSASFQTVRMRKCPAAGFAQNVHLSGARIVEGLIGNGLLLDGRDDAALVLDPGADDRFAAFTAEVWVRLRRTPEGRAIALGKRSTGREGWEYLLGVDGSGTPFATVRLARGTDSVTVELRGRERLPIGRFHHLAVGMSRSRGRVALYVDGRGVDTVWLEGPLSLSGAPGKVWIGWGPPGPPGESIVGWPGVIDELRLSNVDRYPFALDAIDGHKLEDEDWRTLRARTAIELDRLHARAKELLLEGVTDVPRFIEWCLRDRARWFERREVRQIERALDECSAALGALEARRGGLRPVAHRALDSPVSLAPEGSLPGERGVFHFRVRRISDQRSDVFADGIDGSGAATLFLSAGGRCVFVPVEGWVNEGEAPPRVSATTDVPDASGDWKLCILSDPGVLALSVEGQEVFRTTTDRTRKGAALSVFDLAGSLEGGRRKLTLELAGESAITVGEVRAFLVDTRMVSYREGEDGRARALIAGDRFTVLALDADGRHDTAFFDQSGKIPARADLIPQCGREPLFGVAVSGRGTVLVCEFWDLVAAVRACGGNLLSISFAALTRSQERRAFGPSAGQAVRWAGAAGMRLCIRLDAQDVGSLLGDLGDGLSAAMLQETLLFELDARSEEELALARNALRDAGVPERDILAPRFDGRFTDGRGLALQVGRALDADRDDAPRRAFFLGDAGWRRMLPRDSTEVYLWNWAAELPCASNGGLGVPHPEALLFEARVLSHSLGLGGVTVAVEGYDAWPASDRRTGVARRHVERTAMLAGCLAPAVAAKGDLTSSGGDLIAISARDLNVVAGARYAGPRLTDESPAIAASRIDSQTACGIVVASHGGGAKVPFVLSEAFHVYGVNEFGFRVLDLPFFNLAEEGLVIPVLADTSVSFYEISSQTVGARR